MTTTVASVPEETGTPYTLSHLDALESATWDLYQDSVSRGFGASVRPVLGRRLPAR